MGKGRDKKKKSKAAGRGKAEQVEKAMNSKKAKKGRFDSSDDEEDLDAILASFKAKVSSMGCVVVIVDAHWLL